MIILTLAAGCEKSEVPVEKAASTDQKDIAVDEPVEEPAEGSAEEPAEESVEESVEAPAADSSANAESEYVDLTSLSGTMVYAEVYNIMSYPENYIGKTVRMDGVYSVYHDVSSGKYYHACIISDATACCSQGIEFELKGDPSYPEDYPEEGGQICVEGVFDTYEEGEQKYCTLRDSEIKTP